VTPTKVKAIAELFHVEMDMQNVETFKHSIDVLNSEFMRIVSDKLDAFRQALKISTEPSRDPNPKL
jgi:hypothetical protein